MSLLQFFQREEDAAPTSAGLAVAQLPLVEGLDEMEQSSIKAAVSIQGKPKKKKQIYSPKDRAVIGNYAAANGVASCLRHFKIKYPNLIESTARKFKKLYSASAFGNTSTATVTELPLMKMGRPLNLPLEIDNKLQRFLIKVREAGGVINVQVINGVVMGLVQANLSKYGYLLNFEPTRGWRQSLYRRLRFTKRRSTTSRPPVSTLAYSEAKLRYHQRIKLVVRLYSIPEPLIVTIDQTPSKFIEVSNNTMAQKNSKRVPIKGTTDRTAITLTVGISLDGQMLPFQAIYPGKTMRSCPSPDLLPPGTLISANPSHWSNEQETHKLVNEVWI